MVVGGRSVDVWRRVGAKEDLGRVGRRGVFGAEVFMIMVFEKRETTHGEIEVVDMEVVELVGVEGDEGSRGGGKGRLKRGDRLRIRVVVAAAAGKPSHV